MKSTNTKKIRIFAGPNGSGKTTLITSLNEQKYFKRLPFINADIVEEKIKEKGYFDFNEFKITVSSETFKEYLKGGISIKKDKINTEKALSHTLIEKNKFYYSEKINSYLSADICTFCRNKLLEKGQSFIMETVFSHRSKLELMKKAKNLGYKIYFYFISTDSPEVNINRVSGRVKKGGHNVPEHKITERYYKSLKLLNEALKISYRSYLWDNSNKSAELFAEIHKGKGTIHTQMSTPHWFIKYILNKNNPPQ